MPERQHRPKAGKKRKKTHKVGLFFLLPASPGGCFPTTVDLLSVIQSIRSMHCGPGALPGENRMTRFPMYPRTVRHTIPAWTVGEHLFTHVGCEARLLFKHFGCKARFLFNHFLVQSKTFLINNFGCEERLLFKHVGCKARLLFNDFGCEARICLNIVGASKTFVQKFWVQSNTFVQP